MTVLPFSNPNEELQLTAASAEITVSGLGKDEEIVISCEISSLPTYNCIVIFSKASQRTHLVGHMDFQANRPLVKAEITVEPADFRKLEMMCLRGVPVRPITFYLQILKSKNITNGEIEKIDTDFRLDIQDFSWRYPLF
jgi:hypothetical protein